jgi:hypothetical protein
VTTIGNHHQSDMNIASKLPRMIKILFRQDDCT